MYFQPSEIMWVVQFSRSDVSDSLQPHEPKHARPPCPSITPTSLSKLMMIESVMSSNHLILCHPLLLLPPIPPSIRVFSNESTLRMRWPKYWSFMTTGKTIALTRRTFVGKVMSQLLNMLSRLVITFLPRSKRLLISWLQSPSAVILEPKKIKSDTVSTVSPSISYEVMGPDAMILVFWMLSSKQYISVACF